MSNIQLRPATTDDTERVWKWRNEPSVRAASRESNFIPLDDHKDWFERRLRDPDTVILIVVDESGTDVGYVRFEIEVDKAEISIALDLTARGMGIGTAAIRSASEMLNNQGQVRTIDALIKSANEGSIRAFSNAGYDVADGSMDDPDMIKMTRGPKH